MSKLALLQQQAALAAQTSEDMRESVAGGGGRLLPEGYAFARLVEVVEFGNQPQEFQGKAKEPALEIQLGFALWGQGYQNEDGTPYVCRPYPFAISRNEKAKAFKTFAVLNWTGQASCFAQLIGQAFLVKIVHVKNKTDGKVSSRVDLAGTLPPLDPVTKQPYPIPDAPDSLYRLFLWDNPTLEAWDELYIEGTWDAKDGKPAQSKNRIQETILSALDFDGSALDLLLKVNGRAVAKPAPAPAAALPAAPAGVGITQLPQAPVSPGNALPQAPALPAAPAVPLPPPATTTPALPAAPAAGVTTSPSSLPSLPTLPGLPSLPQ